MKMQGGGKTDTTQSVVVVQAQELILTEKPNKGTEMFESESSCLVEKSLSEGCEV